MTVYCLFVLVLLGIPSFLEANDILFKKWDIRDPLGRKCDEGTCNHDVSDIRLEYTISHLAKYPRYRILRKDCEEVFDDGEEPIRDSSPEGVKVVNNYAVMSTSRKLNDDEQSAISSAEFLIAVDSFSSWSSWLSDITKNRRTLEFCVRFSLWTSSKSDAIEVNFRDINVDVTLLDKKTKDTRQKDNDNDASSITKSGFVVNDVKLVPLELIGVEVNILGASSKMDNSKKDDKDESRDEL